MGGHSENEDLTQSDSPGRAAVWAAMLLTFVVFFAHAAWPVPDHNEAHYLAKAKHYWNPTWCEGDFFLESDDAHLAFYWSIGPLTRWLTLPAVAWVGRIIGWSLLAWSWCRLCLAINLRPLLAPFSAALFVALLDRYQMAGEWVVGGVEAKVFAYAFMFLAIEALVRGHWNRAWLLLGGATAWHALVGGWSAVAVAACWLCDPHRPRFGNIAPSLIGGVLLASVGLVPALALNLGISSEVIDLANQIYVFDRLPHHLAIHATHDAAQRLIRHGLLIALLAALCWRFRREQVPEDSRHPVHSMQHVRWFAWTAVLIALGGLVIAVATHHNPALAARFLRYYWFRLTDVAVPMAVALLGVGYLSILLERRPRLGALTLAIVLAFSLGHLVDLANQHLHMLSPRGDSRLANYADWRDACDWITKNTPKDAGFLTPRRSQTFHWHAGRREVVVYKNIPQNASAIVEWRSRINTIHRWFGNEVYAYYPNLTYRTPQELVVLGERYHANYLLTEDEKPLDLPLVYGNSTYAIYWIEK